MRRTLLFAALACAASALAGCADDAPAATTPEPEPVRLAAVVESDGARPVRAVGLVEPADPHALSFKIGGVVTDVFVDEGDAVRRGQTLARIDLREVDARVSAARQGAAQAGLGAAQAGQGVAQAEAGAAKARRDLDRALALYADSVATLEQVQDARTGVEVAERVLGAARAGLGAAQAAAGAARSGVDAAAVDRRYAVITAPSSGVVLSRSADVGQVVGPGTPVVTTTAGGRGWVVRVGVADREAVRLRVGDRATVTLDAYPDADVSGRVSQIAASAAAGSGTYDVEVAISGGGRRLAAGLVGRVAVFASGGGEAAVRLVPLAALLEGDGDRGFVFVVDAAGRARRRDVRIAYVDEEHAAVSAGLAGVDRVVADGAGFLDDGDAVRVVTETAARGR